MRRTVRKPTRVLPISFLLLIPHVLDLVPKVADRPGIVVPGDYVRDKSAIDSGRWKREGGLLSKGGHKCGM